MADCTGPDCENTASTGSVLCVGCEQRWMRERDQVVKIAEHLTERAAQFEAWCRDRGLPEPFKD